MSTIRKLARLIQKLPDPESGRAGIALAKLVLADYTRSKQVTRRDDGALQIEQPDTALDILEDESDAFIALFRSLPKNSEVFDHIETLAGTVESLQRALTGLSQALKTEIGSESDSDEVEGIKAQTDFASFADRLAESGEGLEELGTLVTTLKSMTAHQVDKEIQPVTHTLPSKEIKLPDVMPDNDDEEDEDEAG